MDGYRPTAHSSSQTPRGPDAGEKAGGWRAGARSHGHLGRTLGETPEAAAARSKQAATLLHDLVRGLPPSPRDPGRSERARGLLGHPPFPWFSQAPTPRLGCSPASLCPGTQVCIHLRRPCCRRWPSPPPRATRFPKSHPISLFKVRRSAHSYLPGRGDACIQAREAPGKVPRCFWERRALCQERPRERSAVHEGGAWNGCK